VAARYCPFDVVITPANYGDPAQRQAADAIYGDCLAAGLDALLDDRDERPGVKFKDADLIGVPQRIVVGRKLEPAWWSAISRAALQLARRSPRPLPPPRCADETGYAARQPVAHLPCGWRFSSHSKAQRRLPRSTIRSEP
jgi:prolyl-tRNA synthetase